MKNQSIISSALCVALLGGCATATPPTKSEEDLNDALAEYQRIADLAGIDGSQVTRSDSASFAGAIGGETQYDVEGSFLGDLSMEVDFGAGTVTGSVTNINLFDTENKPDQTLGGSLEIDGTVDNYNASLDATAEGTLSGVDDGISGSAYTEMNLAGEFVDDSAENGGWAIISSDYGSYGTADGDYYVYFPDIDFYAVEQADE